ncbi:MAG TPA: tryptophan--tRNA ligase [Thermodesulfovibrio thiophilus]|uniref:tryptophan--tRNA ligase n=1 Tax=Thermodesulfovibrio thiophilus TaxID=340095 RepID=UPI00040C2547|nr:tryptophan--tRNA ligase [Thermodesulfovibrio thiophilus]HHW20254.1 tryptophan--tRNA ligase [Thermodesulfovibrio thiophilus]HOA82977.1 tryptophan--tRNA ligase [Thermodesulfovibrio thiophilus]HQA03523.1 tryptophan--tRNA ligase [Thermodesulfovibrio thiophilus]HQD36052.1 tryptophan--tRNA ligase [Thermodesulfovibrio thiophilus]
MDRVLSGIQPSGPLHLGNLIGALSNWIRLQDKYECYFFVADLHALTTGYGNPYQIKEYTVDLLMNFIAAGLNPEKSTIFIQSQIPEHSELHVFLSMITPLGWLERVPTYKEKKEQIKDKDLDTYGFLGYPVLQTADIIIYRAKYVPVGVDQIPHLELSREIARRFNYLYENEFFPEPEALLTDFPKVPGTDGRKMSKSYGNAIYLSDNQTIVTEKISTMVTDPARKRRTDKGDPAKCPVFDLHKIFSTEDEKKEITIGCTTASIGCIDCKKILIKHVIETLRPIWEKRQELINNPSLLIDIAHEGSKKAKKVAGETLKEMKEVIGWIF